MSSSEAKSKTIEIGSTNLVFSRVSIPAGLVIDSVEVEAGSVKVNSKSGRLSLVQPAQLKAQVSSDDLCNFLAIKLPIKLNNLELDISGGKIRLKGALKMVVSLQANVECELLIHNGDKLSVQLVSVDVQGVGAKSLLQNTLDQINPVFELSDLPVKGVITEIECENGKVTVRGELTEIFG